MTLNPIPGTTGNDTITGTFQDDHITGLAGIDTIEARAGDDHVEAGIGNDWVSGGLGDDIIEGGDGADELYGDGDNDEIYGGAKDDIIDGGHGDDLLDGGGGNDTIDGGVGFDTAVLNQWMDRYHVWADRSGPDIEIVVEYDGEVDRFKNVELFDSAGTYAYYLELIDATNTFVSDAQVKELIIGTDDADTITANGYDVIHSGAGDDVITVDGLGIDVFAGDGDDIIDIYDGTAHGGDDDDVFTLWTADTTAKGEDGNDTYHMHGGYASDHDGTNTFHILGDGEVWTNRESTVHFNGNREDFTFTSGSAGADFTSANSSGFVYGAGTWVFDDMTTTSVEFPYWFALGDGIFDVHRNGWVAATDMNLYLSDNDGDSAVLYELRDSDVTQNWWADGGMVDASNGYVTSNFDDIWIKADASEGMSTVEMRVYDGVLWSNWEELTINTLPNDPPVVEVADQIIRPLDWKLLSDVLTVTDTEGDTITEYEIWDSAGGDNNWWADGGIVNAETGYTTSDLSDIWFQGAATDGTQTLWVRAFDGLDWSAWDTFQMITDGQPNTGPTIDVADQTVAPLDWVQLSDVMTATDPEGDAIIEYEIWDSEGGDDNWWADGGIVDSSAGYKTSDLSDIWFQGAAGDDTQTLWVRAYDGLDWGAWDSFDLITDNSINTAPVVTVADQMVAPLEWVQLSDVMTAVDANGDTITEYEVWDSEGGDDNWWVGGTVDASTGYTTSDLSNIWFEGAASAGEQTLWVRAYDGTDWSNWDSFELITA